MARRSRARTARAIPKTLSGIIGLAALAAVAYFADWIPDEYLGEPATPTATPTAPPTAPVGDLLNTPNTFTTARHALYTQIYHDRRLTFYCGCEYDADRRIDL